MDFPAIVKVLSVFAAILLTIRLRVPLGIGLTAGGLLLGAWAGRSPAELVGDLRAALTRVDLWLLLVVVALIVELGRFLAEARNANAMMAAARRFGGRHGRALSLMALPAFIGLVPMPGGALFSAPLVDQTVREPHWTPAWKAAINYWFRHVWEYWWPLYPVVILTLSIFDISTARFTVALLPLSLLAILSGFLFLVRPHLTPLAAGEPEAPDGWRRALFLAVPILIIVLATLLLPPLLAALWPGWSGQTPKLAAMLFGLIAGLGLILWDERHKLDHVPFAHLLKPKTLNILASLAGVLLFESLLHRSGLVPLAGRELVSSGIPIGVIVAALPFVAGLVTGIAIGFAGPAFPLVVGLLAAPASNLTPMAALVLAFGFGYAGMMLSPVHLCFVLTRDYFATPFRGIYRHILPCVLVLLTGSLLLFLVFGHLGW